MNDIYTALIITITVTAFLTFIGVTLRIYHHYRVYYCILCKYTIVDPPIHICDECLGRC